MRSFAPNPDAYDPDYHYQLAIDAGCNAYAAPLGSLESRRAKFAGQIPLILKVNNSDTLAKIDQPCSAITSSVEDALRLGCVAVGYTIYPGSGQRNAMYQDLREITLEAKRKGLVVVVWSYPRGAGLSKAGETGDRRLRLRRDDRRPARRAHHQGQAADGAHRARRGEEGLREVQDPDRDAHRARAATSSRRRFNGKRIVIFSGGEAKGTDARPRRGEGARRGRLVRLASWAATPSSARAPTRSSSSPT